MTTDMSMTKDCKKDMDFAIIKIFQSVLDIDMTTQELLILL